MFQKKSHPVKIKINYHPQLMPKKKKKNLPTGNVIVQKKKGATILATVLPKNKGKKTQGREKKKKIQLKVEVFV